MSKELKFLDLSSRHSGITDTISNFYAEAARVCLDRHHVSSVSFAIHDNSTKISADATWHQTDHQTRMSWNNTTDATEAGAYAVALACIECCRDLVAIGRAETCTGADYYVHERGKTTDDFETSYRLEVSGTDRGDISQISQRLKTKITQAQAGASNVPAIACVVGFQSLYILQADVP